MRLLCIDDKGRPNEIPGDRWPKKDKEYTPIRITYHPMQGVQGVELQEIRLTKENYPYEFYKLSRFGIRAEDLEELKALIEASNDLDGIEINIEELEELIL